MTTPEAFLPFIARIVSAFEAGEYQAIDLENRPFNDQERAILDALRGIQRRHLHLEHVLRQCLIGDYSVRIADSDAIDPVGRLINEVFGKLREVVAQANAISDGDYSAEISPQSDKDELGSALFKMTKTLREIAEVSSNIAAGDFSKLVEIKSERDHLARTINMMICSLQEMARQAKEISEGNYEMKIGIRSEQDELAKSIDKMMKLIRSQLVALQESNQGLLEFAHVASHDLNAPLCKIKYSCDLIKDACEGKLQGNLFQLFDVIVRSCNQMANLIKDLLAHARVGGTTVVFTQVDLNEVVKDILADLSPQLHDAGAQVTVAPLPSVLSDRTSLMQLFQNLIGNALKYRGNRALLIEVAVCPDDEQWIFSIKDNGIGIDAVHHQRIFDAFVRLQASADVSGTGIGLATCKKIAKQLQGKIWVESEPGNGSTFYVAIPKSFSETSAGKSSKLPKRRILLVDDDNDQMLILATILEKGNFEVETSNSAVTGLESVCHTHFDLIISDVQMPIMSGTQFLKELRKNSTVPILMLTSSGPESEHELRALGANDFCTKRDAYTHLMSKVLLLLEAK